MVGVTIGSQSGTKGVPKKNECVVGVPKREKRPCGGSILAVAHRVHQLHVSRLKVRHEPGGGGHQHVRLVSQSGLLRRHVVVHQRQQRHLVPTVVHQLGEVGTSLGGRVRIGIACYCMLSSGKKKVQKRAYSPVCLRARMPNMTVYIRP